MILKSAMVGSGEADVGADKADGEAVSGVTVVARREASRRKTNLGVIQENSIATAMTNECEGVTMAMCLCEWRGDAAEAVMRSLVGTCDGVIGGVE